MNSRSKWMAVTTAGVICVLSAGVVLAQQTALPGQVSDGQNDKQVVKLMTEHKMTLAKAVESAEQHSKGHAISAHAHMRGADAVISVVVVADDITKHLTVDVNTGKVSEQTAAEAGGKEGHRTAAKTRPQNKKKP